MKRLKRNQMKKPFRFLAGLLSLILVVSLFPQGLRTVQAAGNVLETDGGKITWDFGDGSSPIYTDGQDGSLSAEGTLALNSGGHGADIGNDTVFTLTVPAGRTTVSFGICAYGSSMAVVKANGQIIAEDLPLNGALEDGAETSVSYTSDAEAVITVEVTGNGYIHHISAETITPPRTAMVSGSVSAASGSGDSADGQTLLFTDEAGSEVETVINEDAYSVSLPVGHAYTVSFENSDVYEVTEGSTVDLTDAENGDEAVNDITYHIIWDLSKDFHFTIGDTVFTVTPGASASDDFSVTAEGGDGRTELATPETAIIWADLEGGGLGTLMQDTLEDVSENVSYTIDGNTVTFTYNDADTSPLSYTVQVKDNSASGNPHANGRTITYDFGDGSIVSELYTGNYSITGGDSVSSPDGLVTLTGNNRIRYNGSHGIMIGNGDQVSVKVAGNAEIVMELCAYTADGSMLNADVIDGNGAVTPESVSAKAAADGNTEVFSYTGEAATLTFTYEGSGSGYLHTMAVTNEMEETEVNPQDAMPEIRDFGSPDSMTASAAGQRLTFTQTGGSLPTGGALSENVGYYGFDLTSDRNRLEADVTVNSCGSSSSKGVFFGAFDGTNIETAAIRNTTNLRGVYSDETGEIGAGRMNETIAAGSTVHFTAERTEDGLIITAVPESGQRFVMLSSDSDALFAENGEETEISFGFILADASVTVTNMKYYDADGTLLYDQNDCYEPIGTEPVVSSVQAVVADTRDAINVTWNSREPADGDGRYVIQVRKDGGEWEDAAETTATSWLYRTDEAGQYQFRVGGKLGNEGEVTYCDELSEVVDFLPALPTPVLSLTAGENSIDLSWTESEGATAYEVYRYSSDEGAENSKLIYSTEAATGTAYTDTDVTPEVPYYYYVIACAYADGQEVNSSNPSRTVWAMASAGHTGDYVYEDEAAEITITESPQGTIFRETAVLAGTVDRAGVIRASVNGGTASEQAVNAGGNFRFSLTAAEGRNNAELIFTDENGKETRLVYTFVYLTNYDMVVDASYTGEDGALINGLPTYSTVQAAVDAVPSDNAERQVIYIKSGDYKERLVVNTPYISLIGEDSDSVRIHCYPAELYPEDAGYEAGGDMSKRCATYIMSGATGFSAENLTFANDYDYSTPDGKSNKSADALRCDADGASFVNVTISGVQDTLYMHAGNQYYRNCRIEGLIDFIYSGDDARALFEDCELVFVYEETHPEGGYVCAPRTAADAPYGLIFNDCVITSEEGCVDGTYRLARPWGPDACIYWIGCYMGSAIDKDEPYADMSGNLHTEARFYECGSYGPGYAVNADRRQISPAAAEALLADLGWNPCEASQAISKSYVGDIVTEVPEEPEEPPTEEPDEPVTPPAEDPSQEPSDPSGEGGGTDTEVRPGDNGVSGDKETEGSAGSDGQKSEELAADPVDTGDHTNIALWSTVLVLAGAAGASAVVIRRRGRQSR